MDVKSTFLHGDLQEEIYMEQPLDYVQNDSNLVFHLKKSLYGVKQASWAWHAKMDSFLLDIIFSRCHSNPNVYTKKVENCLIILFFYVDDINLTGSDPKILNFVKSNLTNKFEMIDLGYCIISLASKYCKPRKEFPIPSLSISTQVEYLKRPLT
jgi:hypothetical protein